MPCSCCEWANKKPTVSDPGVRDESVPPGIVRQVGVQSHVTISEPPGSVVGESVNLPSAVANQQRSNASLGDSKIPDGKVGAADWEDSLPQRGVGRRTPQERGLPTDENLQKLAKVYLDAQILHWPSLVGRVLPPTGDATFMAMAEQFREQFLSKRTIPSDALQHLPAGTHLALSYLRYSSETSNPRSLDDQLRLQLNSPA